MCNVSYYSSKDSFQSLRRFLIFVTGEQVDIDLRHELKSMLDVLEFPYKDRSDAPRCGITTDGGSMFVAWGKLEIQSTPDMDLTKMIPLLLKKVPKLQRVTRAELHRYNYAGENYVECFRVLKPVTADLEGIGASMVKGELISSELSGVF